MELAEDKLPLAVELPLRYCNWKVGSVLPMVPVARLGEYCW